MVGRVGYAPTTPAMSMQYSTIELTALKFKPKIKNTNLQLNFEFSYIYSNVFLKNIFDLKIFLKPLCFKKS